MPSEVFYAPEGERGHALRRREDAAKTICRDCPVLVPCREYALTVQEPYGVWGATTPLERRQQLDGARVSSYAPRA
jgi:WhiB family redox-sensing transcriptional regulator